MNRGRRSRGYSLVGWRLPSGRGWYRRTTPHRRKPTTTLRGREAPPLPACATTDATIRASFPYAFLTFLQTPKEKRRFLQNTTNSRGKATTSLKDTLCLSTFSYVFIFFPTFPLLSQTFSNLLKPSLTFSNLLLPSSTFFYLLLPSLPSLPSLPKSFKDIQTHPNTFKKYEKVGAILVEKIEKVEKVEKVEEGRRR